MRDISNTDRSISIIETSGENGDPSVSSSRKEFFKNLIKSADTVPMSLIFKHYGIRVDEYNIYMRCPFKHHKEGRERTPSFKFYPSTNTFWCFGCKTGRAPSDFVSVMDGISKAKAASKILEQFNSDVDMEFSSNDLESFSERLDIMMSFSNTIREFRTNHFANDLAFKFIEDICSIYDDLALKKGINNESLKHIFDKLKPIIINYKG